MKLVMFNSGRLGALLEGGSVVDLNSAYAAYLEIKGVADPIAQAESKVPSDMLAFIEKGEEGLEAARKAIDHAKKGPAEGGKLLYELGEVDLMAPLPSLASRIAMAGANFYDHAADAYSKIRGVDITSDEIRKQVEAGENVPWGFWKQARNVIPTGGEVIHPARTQRLDYEVEVAAIIGKKGKDIPEEKALDHVYGYTIVLDMSCRDGSRGDRGLFFAKNFDTSVPMGPCIVTADEIKDPHKLGLHLKVDGVVRQDGTQEDMIRGYPWWISFLTRDLTFYPGDIVCGGTCSGTAMDQTPRDSNGVADPALFLKPGQTIEATVEPIGTLVVRVVAKE
jgi:2-keto-4-pentenoate hydratase/2-oxohepta-3-ene-1,7-dioic acid hydratase in catechol pathway